MENPDKIREMLVRLLSHECTHSCADEGTACFYCWGEWDNCIADFHHRAGSV